MRDESPDSPDVEARDRADRSSRLSPADGTCFHCGLPLAGSATVGRFAVRIAGAQRPMCCPGCHAVAQAIVDGGLERYYLHREALPAAATDTVPASLTQLQLYDDPVIQASFVSPVETAAAGRSRERAGAVTAGNEREAALLIEGITCAACVWLVERTLSRVPGVTGFAVNYSTRRARVRWDSGQARLSAILAAVAAIGYRASPFDAGRVETLHRRERARALARLAIAGLGMMQVMMYALPVWLAGADMSADIEQLMRWAGLILTVPVIAYSASPIFGSAWRDLRRGRVGMDVPVAIGLLAAFAASVYATLAGTGDVYFDSVTMFVFLLLAARFLESQVRARAARATDELARLIPATADRMTGWPQAQSVETVPVAKLLAGDVVLVRPGERIPGDGHLLEGSGEVDESLLTGESRPVLRETGAPLVGGAVNLLSPLVMRIDRIGEQTVIAGIVRLLDRAASEKPPLAALADRVAGRFVFGLLLVAAATALWWSLHDPSRALWITVAVLVITCPCALSLATPAALAAAASGLARTGLLPVRAHAVETLARATHFVFDKTGTLTTGRLRVTCVELCAGAGAGSAARVAAGLLDPDARRRRRILDQVAALEHRSEHPIGRALHEFAGRGLAGAAHHMRVDGLRHVPGGGVEATVEGVTLRLGTPAFVAALARPVADPASAADAGTAAAMDRGETLVALGDASGMLARFTLADQLRPGARALLTGLRAAGREVLLLSGDQAATVEAVARDLGLPVDPATVRGGMTPEAKVTFVRELQARGAVVAMMGDGVNDAPVLAQAQVSIAPGCATQVAQAAADMIWLSSGETADMRKLGEAITIACRTLRVIRQNLAWSAAYNLFAVPLAVAGLVTPWVAALGMSSSSLLVVGNAMRLLRHDGAPDRPGISVARPAMGSLP